MFSGSSKEQKLAALSVLRSCTRAEIRTIARTGDEVAVRAGEVLCRSSDHVRPVLILLSGRARLGGGRTLEAGDVHDADDDRGDVRMVTDGRVLVIEPRAYRRLRRSGARRA